jgi:outer membrane protein assembly factor BamB
MAEGHAPEANPPTLWSETKNIRWKVPVAGQAWSSPIVAGNTIYVTTAVVDAENLSLRALAFDLQTGSALWEKEVIAVPVGAIHKKNSHASPTPICEDDRLYVHFGNHGTACLAATNGDVLWTQTGLPYTPVHGSGGSPVLYQDRLIFSCDGAENPFVVALSKTDGAILWKKPREVAVKSPFSFSTPLVIEVAGESQVILPGSGAVMAYRPSDGSEIWRCRYGEGFSVVPRPVYHDGLVYVCSGFARAILYAIRVDGTGDVTDTHVVWTDDKAVPKESSPIVVNGLIFLNDDKGILSCFDAKTGTEHYRERLDGEGGYSASPVYAGGLLYFHNGSGVTTVVKPDKVFRKIAENRIGEFGLSSFAVVADGFIIRTESSLIRIGE